LNRKLVYVLAASDYGPMIVSRLDYDLGKQGLGVGACILENGDCEIKEIIAAGQILHGLRDTRGNGVTVIDGGANVGCHTIAWSNLMRGWGTVTAVEPQERVFYALCGNIAMNNCTNAKAIKAVIGAEPGEMDIPEWDPEIAHNSGGCHMDVECDPGAPPMLRKVKIRVMQIDALNLKRLDFLKLDIEGMEPKALDGARQTIWRCKPIIQAEHHICGWNTIKLHVGDDYEFIPAGINVVCVPKNDPLLQMFEKPDAASRVLLSPD
jgi:FkbM family methyltransferase